MICKACKNNNNSKSCCIAMCFQDKKDMDARLKVIKCKSNMFEEGHKTTSPGLDCPYFPSDPP